MNAAVVFRCEDWEKELLVKIAERSRRTLSDEVKYLIERALGRSHEGRCQVKQEIYCLVCATRLQAFPEYPGEHMKLVPGAARFDFVCDFCDRFIARESFCYAVSMYKDDQYHPWESDYITIEKGGDNDGEGA